MIVSPRWNSVVRMTALSLAKLAAIATCLVSQISDLPNAFAQTASLQGAPTIFDVRRSLPLEPDEPVYHDFYINAGAEAGFKKDMYFTVVRIVPVHDPVQNKQQGELHVGVARLKVIHVARSLTVARLDTEFTDEERPTLEFEAVMIGDRVDPSSGTLEVPVQKKKGKKKADARGEVTESMTVKAEIVVPPPTAQKAIPGIQPAIAPAVAPGAPIVPAAAPAPAVAPVAPAPATTTMQPSVPPKNASQSASGTDMVRLPIPAGADSAAQKM